jgi:hypothetical protein
MLTWKRRQDVEWHEGMMSRIFGAAVLAGLTVAGAASAQEFRGGEIAVEVLTFADDDDLASTSYRGAMEFGVFGDFGAAADLSFQNFGDDEGVRSFTLHGLYDLFGIATTGAFISRDSNDSGAALAYGLEAGRSLGGADVQGFVAFVDGEDANYRVLGAEGSYDLTSSISLNGSVTALGGDGGGFSRFALGGEYRFGGSGPAVFAELGRRSVDDATAGLGATSNYIGIGARLAIGPNRGTTFDGRGLSELVSGF